MQAPYLRFLLIVSLFFSTPLFASETLAGLQQDYIILFQGDSITDGGRAKTGHDLNHIMGQDYAYIIAARVGAEYPERNLTFVNRGVSGSTLPEMVTRWQADTIAEKPNVLSILIGTNDRTRHSETPDQYGQIYDKLIADTQAALPGIKIIICEPFLLPVAGHKAKYASELDDMKKFQDAAAKVAAKYKLPFVAFQKAFDDACQKAPAEHWSWDGIHPTYAGHGLMTEEWIKTVDAFWPGK